MNESQYQKGYIAGYRDGLRDGVQGKAPIPVAEDIRHLPIAAMEVSTRARNCLAAAGCAYISDAAALGEERILAIRNLGPKTAAEIARWLDAHGIVFSAWSSFL